MTDLKRDPVKYIRDKVKHNYVKASECRICGTSESLEFHHFHSVAEMWRKWHKAQKLDITDVDVILEARDRFIEEFYRELVDECVTLCKSDHRKLHVIYGKNPPLITAPKQARWVEKQRIKRLGRDS